MECYGTVYIVHNTVYMMNVVLQHCVLLLVVL
jgi:hypothetical protein